MRTVITAIMMLLMVGLLAGESGCKKSDKSGKTPTKKKTPAAITAAKAQTTCPIEGGKIDKSVYVDYEGKRIYFCCADCKAKFNAYPAQYIKQMQDKGIVLEKTP